MKWHFKIQYHPDQEDRYSHKHQKEYERKMTKVMRKSKETKGEGIENRQY